MLNKIRVGMIGGGPDSFIGAVHRMAIGIDGKFDLVCGAFSSDPTKSKSMAKQLNIVEDRCYDSYQQLILQESKRPVGERVQAVIIVTPNYLHYPVAKLALESGFHVISDKPATLNLKEAHALAQTISQSKKLYALTHTYTGYPMVKKAKALVENNQLGTVKKVIVEYHQGWLANKSDEKSKQASWRLDPTRSGISCCMGDIGTHAANLAEYILGTRIEQVCAELNTQVAERLIDDDGVVLLKFANQVTGHLSASQICTGEENNLRIRIYGTLASLDWSQQDPNTLYLRSNDQPTLQYRTGVAEQSSKLLAATRVPAGHPEGYIEAFANIYKNFSAMFWALEQESHWDISELNSKYDVPGINDAIAGMSFVESVVHASQSNVKWHRIESGVVVSE